MYAYQGCLEFYFATGEGPCPMFIVNHPHPDIWKKTYVFEKKDKPFLKIYHPKTKELVYEGSWTYSRLKTSQNNYFPSPEEIDSKVWVRWCQQQYLVEAILNEKIEADLNSISISYPVDIWEVSQESSILRAQNCRVYPLIEGKRFDAVKPQFQWWSEEEIKNFYYVEKSRELYIFTKSKQYLILPKAEIINADLLDHTECRQPTGCLVSGKKLKDSK